MPPSLAAAAKANIRHLKNSQVEREQHALAINRTKEALLKAEVTFVDNGTHIIIIPIGDPALSRRASQLLMERHNIFVQHINYPTVPKGSERLRITPTPFHTEIMIEQLITALQDVLSELGLYNKVLAEIA